MRSIVLNAMFYYLHHNFSTQCDIFFFNGKQLTNSFLFFINLHNLDWFIKVSRPKLVHRSGMTTSITFSKKFKQLANVFTLQILY